MIAAGVNPKALSTYMGHSSITVEIVTGGTGFGDFPTIAGTFDTTSGGFADVFVAKFARAN